MNSPEPYVLPEKHAKELQRFIKAIKRPKKYNLLIVEYNDQALRRHLIEEIDTLKFQPSIKLDLSLDKIPNTAVFEKNLRNLSQDYSIIHVYNLESRTSEDDFRTFLQEINLHRERIARIAPVNIVFWVLEYQMKRIITDAPDFWAWNSAVLSFHTEKVTEGLEPIPEDHAIAELNVPETRRRIETLIEYLKPKKFDSLNEAETGLVQELDGYRRDIAVYEKSYDYIDSELQTMNEQIGAIFDEFIEYQKTPEKPSGEMNLQDEISFIADHLEVKAGENPLDKALWIQPAVTLLEQVTEENKEVGRLANNLSLTYQNMGDIQNALSYAKKALDIGERTLMPDDPNLSSAYNNVSMTYLDMGDYHNALVFAKKALDIRERTQQPDHTYLATSYNNVSTVYLDMGDYHNALVFAKKSIEINERTLQPDHPSLATSYNNVSLIYKNMGDYHNALVFAKKSIEINERTLHPDHPYLATSYNNVSLIYLNIGDYHNAITFANKALEISEMTLQPDHPDIAISCNNVSLIYRDMGDYHNALVFAKKALDIYDKTLQPDHPSFATSYNNISMIYQDMNDLKRAMHYADKALEIVEKKLPENHPHVKSARDHEKYVQKLLADTNPINS